jgi:hypothetical protein
VVVVAGHFSASVMRNDGGLRIVIEDAASALILPVVKVAREALQCAIEGGAAASS